MNVAVLIRADSALAAKFNPLEGDVDEAVPSVWIGSHVAVRITDAFKTLRQMPAVNGPREFGTAWPRYQIEWADLLAQEEDGAHGAAQRNADANRVRIMPSMDEITRMERAICWPAEYLAGRPDYALAVNLVAKARSIGRDASAVAKAWGGFAETWSMRAMVGCSIIADNLHQLREPVF